MSAQATEDYCINRDGKDLFWLEAESPEQAATLAAQRLYGKAHQLHARRTTGDPGKAGYFRAYQHVYGEGDAWTSVGDPFHVY